jgi:hypothetical protein
MTTVPALPAQQKKPVFQPLMVELLPLHPSAIIVFAVTGGTQAQQIRRWIVRIVVAVRCVQVNRIDDSGSFGDPL